MASEVITSRQNARVKAAVKLRSARQRAKQGRILIDGAREILRALAAGIDVLEVFVCEGLCSSAEARSVLEQLPGSAAVVATVTVEVWEKVRFGEREDGLVAVAQTPVRQIDQLNLPPQALVAVLEGLEKPGNIGAILRTADGAGLDGVIIADPQTDLFNPNTIRASLGTVFAPHICTATVEETQKFLLAHNLPIVAAQPDAKRLYSEIDYRPGAALVLGSEAQGLSAAWQGEQVIGVHLPMQGVADSLNVSATAAVMFYEAVRQRSDSTHRN